MSRERTRPQVVYGEKKLNLKGNEELPRLNPKRGRGERGRFPFIIFYLEGSPPSEMTTAAVSFVWDWIQEPVQID